MKRMLVPMFGDKRDNSALGAAIKLAHTGGVHIDARLFLHDLSSAIPYVGEGIDASSAQRLFKAAQDNLQKRGKSAQENFDAWCAHEKINIGERIENGHSSADFEVVMGQLPNAIIPFARIADINIFVRTDNIDDLDWSDLIQTALFDSGRPTLLVSSVVPASIAKRIVIAWNGSAEAARAVAMTMPLLQQAEAVFIITVDDEGDDHNPSKLAATLEMNGVTATPVSTNADQASVSSALIAKAVKVHADMIVIGAYSHNRLGEMIFGGVTRDLQGRSDIPILMVH
tara:strand:+ start:90889 stop:91743 length:855 start_codon:yes stop_codon:yes gene_type:complete